MNNYIARILKITEKDNYFILKVEKANGIIDDVEMLHPNGILSKPIKDRGVFVFNINKNYSVGLSLKDDRVDFGLSEGDIIIYSTDEQGNVVATIYLANDGNIIIQNDKDFSITCGGAVIESSNNIIAKSDKDIAIESSGNITVDGSKIELNGNTKSFVTFEDLDEALQIFMKALNLHVHSSSGSPPATTMVLDINGSQTQTVKTGG